MTAGNYFCRMKTNEWWSGAPAEVMKTKRFRWGVGGVSEWSGMDFKKNYEKHLMAACLFYCAATKEQDV